MSKIAQEPRLLPLLASVGVKARQPADLLGRWSGVGTALAGAGLVSVGLWGRREVRATLARERIVGPENVGITCGTSARSLAESIRRSTLELVDGRTYAETAPYLDRNGNPTSQREDALLDERTGAPVPNPQVTLWLQSTTLQTALMQAYMAARIAELTIGLGAALVAAGTGVTAVAGRKG